MCGIAGFATTSPLDAVHRKALLEKMLESQHHRGPDDRGHFFDTDITLGHNRLSIIDLSPRGRQPMSNEDGRVQVVFNGEIYNFETLRAELITAGHLFASRTDTEVLVHGYEQWGLPGLLERIEGMFAFGLWDANQRKLYLVRDHFGIKPLYYVERGNGLVFSSELKALIAHDGAVPAIDGAGLLLSFQHIGVPAPDTIYEGYRQLEPGTWLCFHTQTREIKTHRYWYWKIQAEIDDADKATKLLWETICGSVQKHLIADVPVGVFLSGGLDSSLVAAACAELGEKPTCLTIAVADPRYDESSNAAAVCKHFGLPHWIEPMDADAGRPFDARLAEIFDEPFASSAALSAAYISQLAAQRFKVMLSGDGGDELFGGYRWYRAWVDSYGEHGQCLSVWRRPNNALRALFGQRTVPVDPLEGYAQLVSGYTPSRMAGLFNGSLLRQYPAAASARSSYAQIDDPALQGFDRLQSLDMQLFLPAVCLRKMDRTSMAQSLEVRVPLLAKVMASLVGRIDVDVRNPNSTMKGLLKRLAQEKLPKEILLTPKRGFSTPIRRWFSSSSMLQDIANDMAAGEWWRDVFGPDVVRTASRLKGRSLWRFWHTWRWVKQHTRWARQSGVG